MRSVLTGCVELAEKFFKGYDLLIIKTQSLQQIRELDWCESVGEEITQESVECLARHSPSPLGVKRDESMSQSKVGASLKLLSQ